MARMASNFPLPFKSLRTITGCADGAYVIGAMFTAAYADKAERLAASCEKFKLPYVLYEVPTVHYSISRRGTDDLSYTKPNFIRHLLAAHKKPVLYLDADCEFVSQPELIDELAKSCCDFAIYNWYADEYTDSFVPIGLRLSPDEAPIRKRFYRFAGSVDWYTNSQLNCSGLVQFYRNSVAAHALLSRWHHTIASFPDCEDDRALSFTFNNIAKYSWLRWLLNVRWLPKSYARISTWIYAEPIINHADSPAGPSGFREIRDAKGRKFSYHSLMEWRKPALLFPRDCIIDTEQRMVCKLVDGQLIPIEPTDQTFWL
jgi:hypothetical protein